jgi:7-cyano-7-deazaguanine synthase in queuosine biosynthesis
MIKKVFDNPNDMGGYECIATLSGGIDSTVIAHRLVRGDEPVNAMFVYVSYGTQCQEAEIWAAMATCKELGKSLYVLDFPMYHSANAESFLLGTATKDEADPDALFWLVGRNANIVMLLATYAAFHDMWGVYIGINHSDSFGGDYPDTDYRFLTAMNSLLACAFKTRIECLAPLLTEYLEKHEVVKEGQEDWGIDWVKTTHSCSSSVGMNPPCCDYENCPSCSNRKHDFHLNGWDDPFKPASKEELDD